MSKYFKPHSLTFWASFLPVVMGLFVALQPLHGMAEWVEVVNSITGGADPYVLINAGIAGIGLRAAV